jgi:flagellin-like protein
MNNKIQQKFSKNKKGISTIIATIMMILFVLIAAGIVWVVIQNILSSQSEEISSGLDRVTLSIVGSSINITNSEVSLTINRDIGQGDLTKIKIILYDSEGESYAEDVDAESLTELESKKFSVSKGGLTDIEKISIAPITKSASGKESLKGIVYTYNIEK